MDSIGGWLASIVGPLAKRIAVALGFGTLTFMGVAEALEGAWSAVQGAFGGLIAEVAALLAMAGFFDAMSITAGGIMGGVGWMLVKRWALAGNGEAA